MGELKIGWSETSITPAKKVFLTGQFAERISEYVEKPLTATAMALESGDQQMVICSCDLAVTAYTLVDAVRNRLAENTVGLKPEMVILNAIHTHTGPGYYDPFRTAVNGHVLTGLRKTLEQNLKPGQKYMEQVDKRNDPEIATDEEVFAFLTDQIVAVILDAWNSRAEGSFSNAFGRAALGMCRRVTYTDGTAQMWGDSNTACFEAIEGGNDSGIELLYVFDKNQKLTGVVANIACPAQCVQHRKFVSPDYWGEVKLLLRERFGEDLFLLPLLSAAGDQAPVDLVRWVEPESDVNDPNIVHPNPLPRKADPSMFDLKGMRLAGRRVANEIITVYEDGLDAPQSDVVFEHRAEFVPLPIRKVTLTDAKNANQAISDYIRNKNGDLNYVDLARIQIYLGIVQRYELQEHVEFLDAEIHVIRLGSIAIATNPFELFLDYGNKIRARSKAEQTFLVELACGAEGYLPTEKAEKGGHYSAFVSSGQVGHEGGELLVRRTLAEIASMFP